MNNAIVAGDNGNDNRLEMATSHGNQLELDACMKKKLCFRGKNEKKKKSSETKFDYHNCIMLLFTCNHRRK